MDKKIKDFSEFNDVKDIVSLKKAIEPYKESVEVPQSLSPDNIKRMLYSLPDSAYSSDIAVLKMNRPLLRRICAAVAAVAVVAVSVTSSVLLSKRNETPIISDSSAAQVSQSDDYFIQDNTTSSDTAVKSDSVDDVFKNADLSTQSQLESSDNVISDISSSSDTIENLPEGLSPQLPSGYWYTIPSTAKYLDKNNTVYSSVDDRYTAVIDRLAFLKNNSGKYTEEHGLSFGSAAVGTAKSFKNSIISDSSSETDDLSAYNEGCLYSLSPEDMTVSVVKCSLSSSQRLVTIPLRTAIGYADYKQLLVFDNTMAVVYVRNENSKPRTYISFFNIGDPESPMLVRTFSQEGYIQSAFICDGRIFLVTRHSVSGIEDFSQANYEAYLPATYDSNISVLKRNVLSPSDIAVINTNYGTDYTVVSGVDMTDLTENADSYALLGEVDCIKNYRDKLYIVVNNYADSSMLRTNLIALSLGKTINLLNTAVLNGRIYSKNDININNERLYIVTESSVDYSACVYVMSSMLNYVSKLENVYSGIGFDSVRFMNDTVYIIRKTASMPLVIDCSDPFEPVILGAMKEYKFSQYLYPLSDDRFLGITNHQNDSGVSIGSEVLLYDNSDKLSPQVIDRVYIGLKNSGVVLNAIGQHVDISFNKDKSQVSLPVIQTNDAGEVTFSGVQIYDLSNGTIDYVRRITNAAKLDDRNDVYLTLDKDEYIRRTFFTDEGYIAVSKYSMIYADDGSKMKFSCALLCDEETMRTNFNIYYGYYFCNDSVMAYLEFPGLSFKSDYDNEISVIQ